MSSLAPKSAEHQRRRESYWCFGEKFAYTQWCQLRKGTSACRRGRTSVKDSLESQQRSPLDTSIYETCAAGCWGCACCQSSAGTLPAARNDLTGELQDIPAPSPAYSLHAGEHCSLFGPKRQLDTDCGSALPKKQSVTSVRIAAKASTSYMIGNELS